METTLIVLFLTCIVIYLFNRNRKLPPGPWGLPILGYYPFLQDMPFVKFSELSQRYGRIFSFRTVGGQLVVVLNGAKTIKEVFLNRADEIIGRPVVNNLISWATKGYGITQEEGESWREQRRFFLHTSKTLGLGKTEMEDLLHEEVEELIQDLRKANGAPVDIKYMLTHTVGNVITRVLLSTRYDKNDPQFRLIDDALTEILRLFASNANFLVGAYFNLNLLLRPSMWKLKKQKEIVDNITKKIIAEHIKSFDVNNPKDLVDEYLKLMYENRNKKIQNNVFTEGRLHAAILNILVDGIESTGGSIFLLLLELSKYPDVQAAVQQEIDSVVGSDRLPSWLDHHNMPYFEAVIQELWRFAAPVTVTTLYSNFNEMTIHGYRIPKRSIIVANLWSANNDPESFPKPEKFQPERFLTAEGKKEKREGPYPFGLGKRACIGESLSQMEVFVVIASILQSFNVIPRNDEYLLQIVPRLWLVAKFMLFLNKLWLLDNYVSSSLLYAAVVLIITWLILYLWNKNRKLPPGPMGLPIFGFYPFLSAKPHLQFAELTKLYGDVFSFRTVGGKLFVVLNGAKTIKEVLGNRSDEFIGRPVGSNLVAWLSEGYGITQEEGTPWKDHRKFWIQTSKAFGFGKLEMEELLQEKIKLMLDELREIGGKPTDLKYHISYVCSCAISQVLFDKRFDKNDDFFQNIRKAVHDMVKIFAGNRKYLVGLPFDLALWFLPGMDKIRGGRARIRKAINSVVEEHEKTIDQEYPRDYVDAYLVERSNRLKRGKTEENSFSIERLQAISMNLFLEGTESVSWVICSLFSKLSEYPDVQAKIQNELDTLIGKERLPSWTDRPNLPYFEAVNQELFRFVSPFLVTTQYSNFEETTIEGYRIPRRSLIIANLWTINSDPEMYPDPDKFDPERFLGLVGKKIKHEGHYPFGLGKRACAGESLAQMEVFLIIACILQSFTIYPGEEGTFRLIPRD
ncbi:LOW QUALITY PROTEIN: uncharacterized protein LOC129223095 [Uloborus diversus]|uniref:LOW QUALITY PROTEIN: uncharacterized protein LOC129223095 n=1 Tax=Uloborus diversus TaxID=327109 RepID=UPI0024091FFA|nr:LOW QUALITY PROTEIN: uncharacterized protein LOC129223095 [Uloborus diversus]